METREVLLEGIGGASGICIGKAYLVDKEGVDVVRKYPVDPNALQEEINRFKAAVKVSKDELQKRIEQIPEEFRQHAHIIETHVVLLEDKMLYDRTIETIKSEQVNAEWALKKTVSIVKRMFVNMPNDYLKERSDDIIHVYDRIMKNLTGVERVNIGKIDKRVILVANDLSPAETSQIQLERIKGFVTNRGGKACHTSIIAKTLGIPAVMGVGDATMKIKTDDIIIVDGTTGSVIINPSEKTLIEAEDQMALYEQRVAVIARKSHLPATTQDGFRYSIMGNIELPEEVVSVLDNGGEGIGLYRTEFQYLSRRDFPTEDELFEKYKDVIDVLRQKPVTIRTLDINGDKAVNYMGEENEINPALGLRAIRYCLDKPDIFKTQLRAILRAAFYGNVRILIPMISNLDEVTKTKNILDEVCESLMKEGVPFKADVPVGIMMEVPSAVITADLLAKEVDFFSIGTNDLIQYTMAIDRGNRHVAHLYHPLHPAILRMVKRVCDMGSQEGIKTYMCGEMAGDPLYAPILMGLGVDEFSMIPNAIPAVKNMIRSIKADEIDSFVADLMKLTTLEDAHLFVKSVYGDIASETRNIE